MCNIEAYLEALQRVVDAVRCHHRPQLHRLLQRLALPLQEQNKKNVLNIYYDMCDLL